ncbi:Cro/CI family transcriptional regulator [Acinetobacter gerneri]|jgi:DNA-binding transcriptional regulator YiaG|uniref:Cro/CI family transcriptional regulator n=1 Tax=Acinetobacter gerneri TaxID=202952 RepID=UPI0023EFD51E|nr:Cro/CI family transcriptional regulator [Acinetobacter gerneri]MCH4245965.1 Cro/CI family transcriptional regulator [Acinetobacter gerneri]
MRIEIKTSDVLARFNAPKIAKILKISRQAVYQWGDLVPEAAAFKLLEQVPELPHKRVA